MIVLFIVARCATPDNACTHAAGLTVLSSLGSSQVVIADPSVGLMDRGKCVRLGFPSPTISLRDTSLLIP